MPPSPPADLAIRSAVPTDTAIILAFIRELAEYEKLTDQVVADEAQLTATLFGPRPAAEVLIASLADAPVGFALFFRATPRSSGAPASISKTSSCAQPCAAAASATRSWSRARRSRSSATTAASNGACSTGTSPPSASTPPSARRPCRNDRPTLVGDPLRALARPSKA